MVYRPQFYIQMASFYTGPEANGITDQRLLHYSPALLASMLTTAARTLNGQDGGLYKHLDNVSIMLVMEELKSSTNKVSTMIACFHLSYNAMMLDITAKSWNFSGIGFRIAADLDLFSENWNYNETTVEEYETMVRLTWSIFNFNMLLSLYFNRTPEISLAPLFPLEELADTSQENPYQRESVIIHGGNSSKNPSVTTKSCVIEPFKWQCRVMIIMSDILTFVNNKLLSNTIERHFDSEDKMVFITDKIQELSRLRSEIPSYVKADKVENDQLTPQIISMNFCFQVCYLLPLAMSSNLNHPNNKYLQSVSLSAIESTKSLIQTHVTTFGIDCSDFFISYCTYVSFMLLQKLMNQNLHKTDNEILKNLKDFTQLLEKCTFTLSVRSSVMTFVNKANDIFGNAQYQQQQRESHEVTVAPLPFNPTCSLLDRDPVIQVDNSARMFLPQRPMTTLPHEYPFTGLDMTFSSWSRNSLMFKPMDQSSDTTFSEISQMPARSLSVGEDSAYFQTFHRNYCSHSSNVSWLSNGSWEDFLSFEPNNEVDSSSKVTFSDDSKIPGHHISGLG